MRTVRVSTLIGKSTQSKLVAVVALCLVAAHLPVVAGESGVKNLWTRVRGEDWPQFLGPRRNGKSAERGIRTDWETKRPKIVWQQRLGEGYAIGSVAAGRLVQADRVGDKIRTRCWAAETGELLWEYAYPTQYRDYYGYDGGPRCSPLIDGERAYVYGPDGVLLCLHLSSGKLLWKCDTAKRFGVVQNFFGTGSTPVVYGDKLWVMVGGSPDEDQSLGPDRLDRVRGNGTAMVAFDKKTGRVLTKLSDELASYSSPCIVQIDGRPWCFAYCRGGLLAFHPGTGAIDFHYPWRSRLLESVVVSSPVVVGRQVLITETYGPGSSLLQVRPGGYDVVWKDEKRSRQKILQGHMMTPVVHQGYVYACSGRNPPVDLRCFEWKTGKLMWKLDNQYRTSLLYVDQHLVTLDETGMLRLIRVNPQRYAPVAEWDLGQPNALGSGQRLKGPCWAAPILAHGLLFVRGEGRIVCLELIPAEDAR